MDLIFFVGIALYCNLVLVPKLLKYLLSKCFEQIVELIVGLKFSLLIAEIHLFANVSLCKGNLK